MDSVDFTKGLTHRLHAFERLLDKYHMHRYESYILYILLYYNINLPLVFNFFVCICRKSCKKFSTSFAAFNKFCANKLAVTRRGD